MRLNYKIPKSLWIIWLSLLLGVIVLGLTEELISFNSQIDSIQQSLRIGILGSIFSFFTYGVVVWPPTLLFMFVFELAFSKKNMVGKSLKRLLQLEFIIVSIPFAIWAITEHYLYWLYFIAVLGIGQSIRYRYLIKSI
ncbi:hypothetical protein J4E06_04855 [Muricauda sp. NFXS6]|uniref:hypothetical protein n=1 Tax=Allomuricauda sp. NFXS6 TaxID=2819094 RepID=UPI0032DFF0E6